MSVTTKEPVKTEEEKQRLAELKKRADEMQLKKTQETQQNLLHEQNAWFFDLIGIAELRRIKQERESVTGTGEKREKKLAKIKTKTIETIRGKVSEEERQDGKQQKLDLKEAEYEARYDDRLARSKITLAELQAYLPAAQALVDKFKTAHKAAADLLLKTPGAWKEAFEALHEVSVSDALEQAEKLWTASDKSALKADPKLVAAIEQERKSLLLLARMLTAEQMETLRNSLDAAEAPLHVLPAPDSSDITAAGKKLAKVQSAIEQAGKDANSAKGRAEKLMLEVAVLLNDIETAGAKGELPGYTDRDSATLNRQMVSAKTNMGLRDFVMAEQLLGDLKIQIDGMRDSLANKFETAKRAWDVAKQDFAARINEAGVFAADESLPPQIRAEAQAVKERFEKLAATTPGKEMSFDEAVVAAKAAAAAFVALDSAVKAAPAFATARDEADKRVNVVGGETSEAITELGRLLTGAIKEGQPDIMVVLKPFADRHTAIMTNWRTGLEKAMSVAELKEETTTADLLTLRKDVVQAQTGGLADGVTEITLAPARKRYDEKRTQAMRVAQDLIGVNAHDGAELVEAIEQADTQAGNATTQDQLNDLIESLASLIKTNEGRANTSPQAMQAFREMLAEALKPIPEAQQQLTGKVNTISDGATQKCYATLLDTFKTEYETLDALRDTTSRELLEQAIDEAQALSREIEKALGAIDGEKRSGKPPSFKSVRASLAQYKTRLEAEDVKIYMISSAFDIGEKIKEIETGFGTVNLTELSKKVADIGDLVTAAEQGAIKAKAGIFEFEKYVQLDRDRLAKPPFDADAPDFVKTMNGRLDAILADAKFEGGLTAAKVDLGKLRAELDQIANSPVNAIGQPVELVDRQQQALASKQKGELDQAKWEGELKVVEKLLKAALKGAVEPREITGLQKTFEDTKKTIEKSAAYSEGREQLRSIRTRLQLLEANPFGLLISSRNKLPQVVGRVRGEILKLGKALGEVKVAVEKIPPGDLSEENRKIVAAQLASVRGLFDPAAFNASVPLVAAKDTETTKRAAAREAGLRDVRRMMAYVDKDYRLQALMKTPFSPTMRSVISGLKLGLLDLENNLLVSMPA